MKYLKTYKIFESNDFYIKWSKIRKDLKEAREELKDICIELNDEKFETKINIKESIKGQPFTIEVSIFKRAKIGEPQQMITIQKFYLDEVSEVIYRMIDYMNSNSFSFEGVIRMFEEDRFGKWVNITDHFNNNVSDADESFGLISAVKIKFKKIKK